MSRGRSLDGNEQDAGRIRDHQSNKRRRLQLSSAQLDSEADEEHNDSIAEPQILRQMIPLEKDNAFPKSSAPAESSSSLEGHGSESEVENEEPIVTIGGPKRPEMHVSHERLAQSRDLKSKIAAFLPELAEANASLTTKGTSRNMEDVEEGDEHIEMNLGLGVLEEVKSDCSSSSDSDDSDSGSEEGDTNHATDTRIPDQDAKGHSRPDVMSKLLGSSRSKPGNELIKEVT